MGRLGADAVQVNHRAEKKKKKKVLLICVQESGGKLRELETNLVKWEMVVNKRISIVPALMKKLASPSNFFFLCFFFLVDCDLTAFSRSPSALNCLYCSILFDFIVVYSSSIMLLCKVSMAPHGQVLSM